MTETKPITEFAIKVGSKPLKGYLMYAYAMLTNNPKVSSVSITGRDAGIAKACQIAQILRSKLPNLQITLSDYTYENRNHESSKGTQVNILVLKPTGKGD
jgi:DNA-binding protein